MDIKIAGAPPETTRIALGAFDRCGKAGAPRKSISGTGLLIQPLAISASR